MFDSEKDPIDYETNFSTDSKQIKDKEKLFDL
jgi:hypothetical protein